MVDTARHFLSIPVLRRVVDSMITTKLNTLHVHLVDTQAFFRRAVQSGKDKFYRCKKTEECEVRLEEW